MSLSRDQRHDSSFLLHLIRGISRPLVTSGRSLARYAPPIVESPIEKTLPPVEQTEIIVKDYNHTLKTTSRRSRPRETPSKSFPFVPHESANPHRGSGRTIHSRRISSHSAPIFAKALFFPAISEGWEGPGEGSSFPFLCYLISSVASNSFIFPRPRLSRQSEGAHTPYAAYVHSIMCGWDVSMTLGRPTEFSRLCRDVECGPCADPCLS